jgi:hypothetical protein
MKGWFARVECGIDAWPVFDIDLYASLVSSAFSWLYIMQCRNNDEPCATSLNEHDSLSTLVWLWLATNSECLIIERSLRHLMYSRRPHRKDYNARKYTR